MLTVSNLRKDFTTIRAVDGVSLTVQRGHIFGLLGRNGAGKTTTIRCVLNILRPDAGEILYDGKPFSPRVRNTLGYLPEERGLYKKSRLLDTILYFAELRGMQRATAKAESYRWLKRFDLLSHQDRRIEELSKGNQQKVQFISAIIHDPQLVVLDEPFSGLDPVNQIIFKDIFLELKQRGKAVIFSTHQMDQAEKLSDEICLIDHGKVVLHGSVREVKERYGSNSAYLEFDGDGAFLRTLAGVKAVLLYENAAELQFSDGIRAQDLLPSIIARVELRKFELHQPSLQSIFLQTVGNNGEAAA